ncbi:MAG: hypothetical protein DMG58_20515 [Acidobacteria bacterium]|nr:MAG: hypothetical protein DMG58_20515 [Acidobacteriota bacterium]
MFAAYFDESGSPDERRGFLTVAGSVSSTQKWFRFKIQWNAIVKRHGVEVFHMNECASGTGQYAGWTTDQKRNLITDLSECFARHAKEAFAVTVLMESWQSSPRCLARRMPSADDAASPSYDLGKNEGGFRHPWNTTSKTAQSIKAS